VLKFVDNPLIPLEERLEVNETLFRWNVKKEFYEYRCEDWEAETGLKEGAHVRYIGVSDGFLQCPQYYGNPSDPRGILDVGAIYEIECMMIARSFSKLTLVGFAGKEFSASIFEPVNKAEKKKYLKAGGRVRFAGRTGETSVSETVYEVECVYPSKFGFGFTGVKLVGLEDIYERRIFEKVK
jgi:hypothetical protein